MFCIKSTVDDIFEQFQNSITSIYNNSIDYKTTDNGIEVSIELPGVLKNDVELKVLNDILELKATKNKQIINKKYRLLDSLDPGGITSKLELGILTINIPYKEKTLAKTIEIG